MLRDASKTADVPRLHPQEHVSNVKVDIFNASSSMRTEVETELGGDSAGDRVCWVIALRFQSERVRLHAEPSRSRLGIRASTNVPLANKDEPVDSRPIDNPEPTEAAEPMDQQEFVVSIPTAPAPIALKDMTIPLLDICGQWR